ncbi:MAG: ring-cleaving dioxygenase [Bacteroidota bacterium]|nr:ring-cleaving dioxygenase [Bacteroidota bacterium]
MENKILGLHHITAIAGNAQRNLDFYTKVLGLRLVKKTVNFDDPGTYHFYFGNENGTPGTILTFFPWDGIRQGVKGAGMASEIGYSVPLDSLNFWEDRLKHYKVSHDEIAEKFGEKYISFRDPDGLKINLIASSTADNRRPWQTDELNSGVATKGFHNVTLLLKEVTPTAEILTDIFGYKLLKQEGSQYRFVTDAVANASIVDIIEAPGLGHGVGAAGTNHHVAFRVKDGNILMDYREKIEGIGLNITPKIDRDYFFSLYFREPGGVLFELATDNPGFTKDEPLNELGKHLKLPQQYEASREKIEKVLPVLI